MSEQPALHEMPLHRALFMMLRCRLKGGHKPFYIGRTFIGTTPWGERHYKQHYICEHCRKAIILEEYEQ